MNTWYWEHVKLGLVVETAKVDTHMQLSRFLAYKQDWHTIGQHVRMYATLFQHFIYMLRHNIEFVHTKSILLTAWWWCTFINKVNGMVKRTMWS